MQPKITKADPEPRCTYPARAYAAHGPKHALSVTVTRYYICSDLFEKIYPGGESVVDKARSLILAICDQFWTTIFVAVILIFANRSPPIC